MCNIAFAQRGVRGQFYTILKKEDHPKMVKHPMNIKIKKKKACLEIFFCFLIMPPLCNLPQLPSWPHSFHLIISPIILVDLLLFLVTLVTFVLVIWDVVAGATGPVLMPVFLGAFGAVLGVADLPSQAEVLAALVGPLGVSHLQGHGAVVALVCAQLLVINGTPGSWGCHSSLEKTERVRLYTNFSSLLGIDMCPPNC